jgi:hypothetical protein
MPLPAAAYFGIVESADHVPNANRIAFWAAGCDPCGNRFEVYHRLAG